MNRSEVKASKLAARGYGKALFLDEGDDVEADAVIFTRTAGAGTVFATDGYAAPIEATRRTFATDDETYDYMYACLRDQIAARRAARTAATEAAEAERIRNRPTLVQSYRDMGLTGFATTVVWIATAMGWLWISPFTYTREDTFRLYGTSADRGELIFPADSGLVVVAISYGLAVINMAEQWSLGRHDAGRLGRRARSTAIGTAVFATITIVCMVIRSDEIENPLYWLPPALALISGATVAVALFALRETLPSASPPPSKG